MRIAPPAKQSAPLAQPIRAVEALGRGSALILRAFAGPVRVSARGLPAWAVVGRFAKAPPPPRIAQ